jgi:hypothetical protein
MAMMEGAVERVRPKMMTVVAIMAGLLPIMWSAICNLVELNLLVIGSELKLVTSFTIAPKKIR